MNETSEIKRRKYTESCEIRSAYFSRGKRLGDEFFNVPCIDLAKNLLGTILVRKLSGGDLLKGKIVETECYLGYEDKASQSYLGKKTPRNEAMFMKPGTVYVYFTYGMYHCVNISSEGEGAAVLLRAVEPIIGLHEMTNLRKNYHVKRKKNSNTTTLNSKPKKTDYKQFQLCNGPSKLCISFDINIENCNKQHLSEFPDLWIEERTEQIDDSDIIISTRIGIDSAGPEWAGKLLRFYICGNPSVSIRDKKREKLKTLPNNSDE